MAIFHCYVSSPEGMFFLFQIRSSELYGQTPPFARADVHDVSEHQIALCFVGQNAHVHDHGFHLAMQCLAPVR